MLRSETFLRDDLLAELQALSRAGPLPDSAHGIGYRRALEAMMLSFGGHLRDDGLTTQIWLADELRSKLAGLTYAGPPADTAEGRGYMLALNSMALSQGLDSPAHLQRRTSPRTALTDAQRRHRLEVARRRRSR